jgi:hypothetical protein
MSSNKIATGELLSVKYKWLIEPDAVGVWMGRIKWDSTCKIKTELDRWSEIVKLVKAWPQD